MSTCLLVPECLLIPQSHHAWSLSHPPCPFLPIPAGLLHQDSFDLFDKDGTGVIETESLLVVLRALGSEPKKSEIKALVGEVDKEATGQIGFDG